MIRLLSTKIIRVPPVAAASIHTSATRQALPPVLVALVKPLSRITAMLIGRRFRKWYRNMDPQQASRLRQKYQKFSHLIGGMFRFHINK